MGLNVLLGADEGGGGREWNKYDIVFFNELNVIGSHRFASSEFHVYEELLDFKNFSVEFFLRVIFLPRIFNAEYVLP